MKKTTIAVIATNAGVSKSTVSHVINNTRYVEEKTRQRVLDVIEKYNYRPNKLARSLALNQTHTIGLILSDISNPFYHQVIHGVEECAYQNNYIILLFNARYDLARTQDYINTMIDHQVDGIIIMASSLSEETLFALQQSKLPAVIVDHPYPASDNSASIIIDFQTGIKEMVQSLVSAGHTRFAHITSTDNLWTSRMRKEIFLSELNSAGITHDKVDIINGNMHIDGGRDAFKQIIAKNEKPTSIFAVNDLTALGVLFEAQNLGFSLPTDFSIVGVDDIHLCLDVKPSLSTIALPCYEIGINAMTMLINILQNKNDVTEIIIKSRYIQRESSDIKFIPD
ncbi:MAG: LacI family DNA-binding transcriptional regulator [Spirochaetes bacterium]|nr:LacI family DNA-binding transcriptional regulator [Spirochaetota bacterium]